MVLAEEYERIYKKDTKEKTETVETKKSGDGTVESAAWPAGFNGYHHCGAFQYAYCYDPGSRSDCPVSCSHYFCRVLPAGACVRMFPGAA